MNILIYNYFNDKSNTQLNNLISTYFEDVKNVEKYITMYSKALGLIVTFNMTQFKLYLVINNEEGSYYSYSDNKILQEKGEEFLNKFDLKLKINQLLNN